MKTLTVSELRKELKSTNTAFVHVVVKTTQDDEAVMPVTKAQAMRLFAQLDGDTMTTAFKHDGGIII